MTRAEHMTLLDCTLCMRYCLVRSAQPSLHSQSSAVSSDLLPADTAQVELYAEQLAVLRPAISAPFATVAHPRIESMSPPTLSARAWALPPGANRSHCVAFVVAVNTLEDQPAQVWLEFSPDRQYTPYSQYGQHRQHRQHSQHNQCGQHSQHSQHNQHSQHGQHSQHSQHSQYSQYSQYSQHSQYSQQSQYSQHSQCGQISQRRSQDMSPECPPEVYYTYRSLYRYRWPCISTLRRTAAVGGRNAMRMFDATYSVPLQHDRLTDWVGPGSTNNYCVEAT